MNELQYDDDEAVVGSSAEGLQRNLGVIEQAYRKADLVINNAKSEFKAYNSHGDEAGAVYVTDDRLKNVCRDPLILSVLTSTGNVADDIQRRICLAFVVFGLLSEGEFLNGKFSHHI